MTIKKPSRWIVLAAASAAVSCAGEIEAERVASSEAYLVGTGTGLKGEYFDNVDFTSPRLTRLDSIVYFNWNVGSPDPSIGADTFSARWTGQIEAPTTEPYTFYLSSDGGARLWVAGQLVVDAWSDHPFSESKGTIAMTAGQRAELRLEYYENSGTAAVQLFWSSPSRLKGWVLKSNLYPPPSGAQLRPAYNTGTGFFVVGNKLYDANGSEFRIRGLNHLHWDAPGIGIPATGANTERWVIDFSQPISTNIALMRKSINNRIVPMPGNWDGTCDEGASTLSSIVSQWVATAPQWKTVEKYVLINIANEWGPSNSTVWRDQYISAIAQLRAAGIKSTIVVDAGGCGQDNIDLAKYAAAVFNSDPQKNVVFDQHIYGMWKTGVGQSWQTDLAAGLDALVATGLPFILGEVGPGRNIGPSPTSMTPGQIIRAADARGFGWLAWAWDDPPGEYGSAPRDDWFALSFNGDYRSSADLTTFGKDVVENPTYGLKVLARPASIF